MNDNYIVLYFSEDGDLPIIKKYSGIELIAMLSKNFEGCEAPKFITEKMIKGDHQSFSGYLIIKGDVVIPTPVQLVQTWSV
jgi:hypothetical protein